MNAIKYPSEMKMTLKTKRNKAFRKVQQQSNWEFLKIPFLITKKEKAIPTFRF